MKILIISNMYPSEQKTYSGIFVKNQYEYLQKELKKDIDIYTMKRTFTTKLGSVFKYLIFYLRFITFLFKKYDIIHTHFLGYHVYLGVLYKLFHPKTKLVVTIHGSDTKNLKKFFFNLAVNFIDKFLAVGKEQSNEIKQYVSESKVEVLSAGINEKIFYKEINIKKNYDFIFIGSFYEVKGIDIFIKAIKNLNRKNLEYCFVGSGKYCSDIETLKDDFNITIKENNTQEEIRLILNQSKWLVLPSRGDSFGLVVSEAMYCSTPVIVSNIGGMLDQVEHYKNGLILEDNTPELLSSTMVQANLLTKEQYSKFSQYAGKSNKQYSMKNICLKLDNIYKDLINEK